MPAAAQDITFDPDITVDDFRTFSSMLGQSIYASPVDPARAGSIVGFDIGLAATAIEIDENAAYWINSVQSDFTTDSYVIVPRLVVSKGLGFATISATYAEVPDSEISVMGGALDFPLINGGLLRPTLAIRASYATLDGVENYGLDTYGAEVFLSKGFGPITPYVAAGMSRTEADGEIPPFETFEGRLFEETMEQQRVTVGLRLSLLVPKIVVEVTEGEDRTYSAKISFGL